MTGWLALYEHHSGNNDFSPNPETTSHLKIFRCNLIFIIATDVNKSIYLLVNGLYLLNCVGNVSVLFVLLIIVV